MGFFRRFVCYVFSILGLGDFLESGDAARMDLFSERRSISATVLRELLPVMKLSDLVELEQVETPENCAVCLCEVRGDDEIRRLTNCRHIFHRSCLDRWMDHDQKTCPLCRTPFIPGERSEYVWVADGISDLFCDYSPPESRGSWPVRTGIGPQPRAAVPASEGENEAGRSLRNAAAMNTQ